METLPFLPTLNACLNGLAFLLLISGIVQIKRGRETAHKKLMLAALACSVLFLISYLSHHAMVGLSIKYHGPDSWKMAYFAMLLTHTVLAAIVPFLALRTSWLGLRIQAEPNRRAAHKRWARVTAPIWIYVSITGVLIYLVLYIWTDSYTYALNLAPSSN
jgi:putative membrane protein